MSNSLHDTVPFCSKCRTYHPHTYPCADKQPPAKEIPIQKQQLDSKLVNAVPMTREKYLEKMGWGADTVDFYAPGSSDAEGYYLESLARDESGNPVVRTWIPAQQFRELYHMIENMPFELAFQCARKGERIRRAVWKETDYVRLMPASEPKLSSLAFCIGEEVLTSIWVPARSDLFAEDWQVVQDKVDGEPDGA